MSRLQKNMAEDDVMGAKKKYSIFLTCGVCISLLGGCSGKPSDILQPLVNIEKPIVPATEIVDSKWDWICYATEHTVPSEQVTNPSLKWLREKIIETDDFSVWDGHTILIFADEDNEYYEVHQVNDKNIIVTHNPYSIESCFALEHLKFIQIPTSRGTRKVYFLGEE